MNQKMALRLIVLVILIMALAIGSALLIKRSSNMVDDRIRAVTDDRGRS
jgi:hypothetical protein